MEFLFKNNSTGNIFLKKIHYNLNVDLKKKKNQKKTNGIKWYFNKFKVIQGNKKCSFLKNKIEKMEQYLIISNILSAAMLFFIK